MICNQKVLKSGVTESILEFAHFKQRQQMKKTDGHKSSRITGIVKLTDANNAGTKYAKDCYLLLTEGDSAKALVMAGLAVAGRDNYGVFPLKGKLLNVREASSSQIQKNEEITQLKKILGLQQSKTYTSTDSLRYGHLVIMTDQDTDGSHIKGLLLNLFDHFWPSLLKIKGFMMEFITPIVKARKDSKVLSFFTLQEYYNWKKNSPNSHLYHVKYYKGLGSNTEEEGKEYFSNLKTHQIPFSPCSPEDSGKIDLAFNKKKADERKEWLQSFQVLFHRQAFILFRLEHLLTSQSRKSK